MWHDIDTCYLRSTRARAFHKLFQKFISRSRRLAFAADRGIVFDEFIFETNSSVLSRIPGKWIFLGENSFRGTISIFFPERMHNSLFRPAPRSAVYEALRNFSRDAHISMRSSFRAESQSSVLPSLILERDWESRDDPASVEEKVDFGQDKEKKTAGWQYILSRKTKGEVRFRSSSDFAFYIIRNTSLIPKILNLNNFSLNNYVYEFKIFCII